MKSKFINLLIFSSLVLMMLISSTLVLAEDNVDHYQKGLNYFTGGKYEEAIPELVEAIINNPDRMYPHFILGLSYH